MTDPKFYRAGRFLTAEDGAITVDYVVLTAAIAGLGLAILGVMQDGTGDAGAEFSQSFDTATVTLVQATEDNSGTDGSDVDIGGDPFLEGGGDLGGDTGGGTDTGDPGDTTQPIDPTQPDTTDPTTEETAAGDPPEGCWYSASGEVVCN